MNPSALFSPLLALTLAAPLAQTPDATPTPRPITSPIPLPTIGATPAAATSPLPAPSAAAPTPAATSDGCPAAPAVSAAPAPIATPEYTYHFVPHQPAKLTPCQPQIFEVDLNSENLQSSGDIDIRVLTNQYVARVVSKSGGRSGTIPLVQPNEFIAFSKLPKLPFIARGMSLDLQFVGYGVDGRTVTVSVPVKLH